MIQRIQSLFLLLSGITMSAGMYLAPLYAVNGESVFLAESGLYLGMAGLTAGITLANIFLYKNRKLQVVLNRLSIILSFILFGLILTDYIGQPGDAGVSIGLGLVLPLVNVILLVLANRGIQKDELLIRSADRLR